MIKVRLLAKTDAHPLHLAEHAAKTCYQAEMPELKTDEAAAKDFVNKRLFQTGHHTTLQHQYFTFSLENIAISDVTFGLHLTSPFYNSDQRSGRFCGKMFTDPDYDWTSSYLKFFWPGINQTSRHKIMSFIKQGLKLYQDNIEAATNLAKKYLRQERPNLSSQAIEQLAPKIAQEQLRVFIPTILPTALDYTINLSSLVALWQAAWTPVLREVTAKMKFIILAKYPELDFMFKSAQYRQSDWSPGRLRIVGLKTKPTLGFYCLHNYHGLNLPKPDETQPIDLLPFLPQYMENNINEVKTLVEVSIATLGQDQRHRTIRRGPPTVTGSFYFPPLVNELLSLEKISAYCEQANNLGALLPETLGTAILPYGSMVSYQKIASFNALVHEQAKRTCWCAQEEIYHLSCNLRIQLQSFNHHELAGALVPPCFHTEKCAEGDRYCGRKLKNAYNYFALRKV